MGSNPTLSAIDNPAVFLAARLQKSIVLIRNYMPKHKVEVRIIATIPEIWKVVERDKIATQRENSADADYIAFFSRSIRG